MVDLQSFLIFFILTIVKNIDLEFYRLAQFPEFVLLCIVFHNTVEIMNLGKEYHRGDVPFSVNGVKGNIICIKKEKK